MALNSEQKKHKIQILQNKFSNINISKTKELWFELLNEDKTFFLREVKKKGLLRSSRYNYHSKIVRIICEETINRKAEFFLTPNEITYFNSILALINCCEHIRKCNRRIIGLHDKHGLSFIKSLCVCIDYMFLTNYSEEPLGDSNQITTYSKEILAEALSYCIYLFSEKSRKNYNLVPNINEELIKSSTLNNLLVEICKIKKYNQFEILIDNYGYECTKKDSMLEIKAPDKTIEKSIRLGYILSSIQSLNNYSYVKSDIGNTVLSLEDYVDNIYRNLKDEIFEIVELPIKRLVMKIPLINQLIQDLTSDKLFQEELIYLRELAKELLLSEEEYYEYPIKEDITLHDIHKFQRVINFLRLLNNKKLLEIKENDPDTFLRSIIPIFTKAKLVDFVSHFLGKDKSDKIVTLLSWDINSKKMLDLQYQPLVTIGNSMMILSNLLGSSNLLRNILFLEQFRFHDDGVYDPLINILCETLKKRFNNVYKNVSYSFDKVKGEIDVLVVEDNNIYIYECKNSLHPTSFYELRTSYDYLIKGCNQIKTIKNLFNHPEFIGYLSSKLKIELQNQNPALHFSLITSNRLFYGFKIDNIPIHNIHEIINFIESGQITIIDQEFSQWSGKEFNKNLYIKYLENNQFHQIIHSVMDEHISKYSYSNYEVHYQTFYLDIRKLLDEYIKLSAAREQDNI